MAFATKWLALLLLLSVAPASAARPELERELGALVDLFYDMDFDAARAGSDALAKRHPGHPAGPFYRSVSTYQRWTAEGMRSTETFRAFEADLDAAEDSAKALLKTDPAEGHYYLGAADGFRARALGAQHKYMRAVPAAASAVKHLKKALSLDPALEDARLGIGMYHYFAARIPSGAKPFAHFLFGERGDRERGLAELRHVADSTGTARMEARSLLSVILAKDDEADWAEADKLLIELSSRFPHNPLYRLRRVLVAQKRGDFEAAMALADPDGAWIRKLHPSVRGPARDWALYRMAECRLLQGRSGEAKRWLDLLGSEARPRGLKDWVLIRRGNLADAARKPREADAFYDRVKDRAASIAHRFQQERYPGGPKDVAPFFTGY